METTAILVLVLALIVCLCIIRYQMKRERYLIELNNSNEMESSKTMLDMKEEIVMLWDESDSNYMLYTKVYTTNLSLTSKNSELQKQIKLLTQQRNGYKGKVVQLVNERAKLREEIEEYSGKIFDLLVENGKYKPMASKSSDTEFLDKLIIADVDFEETETLQEVADDNEWPEIDITKVLVEPDTKFRFKGVKYIAKDWMKVNSITSICKQCQFHEKECFKINDIQCHLIYFTKPE